MKNLYFKWESFEIWNLYYKSHVGVLNELHKLRFEDRVDTLSMMAYPKIDHSEQVSEIRYTIGSPSHIVDGVDWIIYN